MRRHHTHDSSSGWALGQPEPPPPGPVGRLRRFLARVWSILPTRAGLALLVVWLGLGLLASHLLGAVLLGWIGDSLTVLLICAAATLGLPLVIAPRYDRQPIWWGIVISSMLLLGMGVFARPVSDALTRQGDWDVRWFEARGVTGWPVELARRVMHVSAWGMARVPVEKIDALLEPIAPEGLGFGDPAGRSPSSSLPAGERGTRASPELQPGTSRPDTAHASGGSLAASPGGEGDSREAAAAARAVVSASQQLEQAPQLEVTGREEVRNYVSAQERQAASLLNEERIRRGLTSLEHDDILARTARTHTQTMRSQGQVAGTDGEGRGPQVRAPDSGVGEGGVSELRLRYRLEGDPAQALVLEIVREPEHRSRLLQEQPRLHALGVGLSCEGEDCLAVVLLRE